MKALPPGSVRDPEFGTLAIFVQILVPLLKKDPHLSCPVGLHRIDCSLQLESSGALGFCDHTSPWFPSCVSGCSFMFPFALPPLFDLYMLEWFRVTPSTMPWL